MARCDLCGGKCHAQEMTTLRDQYRVSSVDDICQGCAKWVDAVKNDAVAAVPEKVKAAICERVGAPASEVRPWWRFFR